MKVLVDICVIPMGVGLSVSEHVATCQKIFKAADLNYSMHSYGTNVEGEWDQVMGAIKSCHEAVHDAGAPRISTTIRLGTRTDRDQSMQDKIDSVNEKLG